MCVSREIYTTGQNTPDYRLQEHLNEHVECL